MNAEDQNLISARHAAVLRLLRQTGKRPLTHMREADVD